MNAIVSLDKILEPAPGTLTASTLFGTGAIDAVLRAIEKDVRAEAFDATTEEGRDRIKSVAYKIARSKTTLDDIGKDHVAAIKAQSAAIDKERKTLRDRLDALKDEVRKPVTEWEQSESSRVGSHELALAAIREAGVIPHDATSELIQQRIRSLRDMAQRDWQEFAAQANGALAVADDALRAGLTVAQKRDADAAELARLRAEQTARDAEARRAEEAARQARAEQERAEQAERDKQAAVTAALEAEKRRQEQEAAAVAARKAAEDAAERKRQSNARHRDKVHREIRESLIASAIAPEAADSVLAALIGGAVSHVTINY